jgi:tRNA-dihydrouridine synthase B
VDFFCPAIGLRARQNFMQFFAAQRRIALTMRLPDRLSRQKTRVNADNILHKGEYFAAHKISTFRQLIVKYI